jgi:hypothetical protein
MTAAFEELSRRAAMGTLSEAERVELERHLREHPGDRAVLEWDQAFAAKLAEKVAGMPAMPGWERTERELRAQASAAEPVRAKPAPPRHPGVLDRLSEWLSSWLGFAVNAQAAAVALVVLQAGVIGILGWQFTQTEDESLLRAGAQDSTPRGPLLRVSFRADLPEGELRRALGAIGGEIVGGPGQLGIYLVRIKEGTLGEAAQRLRATGTTELIEIVEAGR